MEPQRINIPQEKLIPNSQITDDQFIGQGGFGRVFKANWNCDTVAVKRLMLEKMDPRAQDEFEQEINLHMKLSHPRVIRLYGIIAEVGEPYGMVMEYAAGGSLFSLLRKIEQSKLSWENRIEIAMDMSSGLQYLHQKGIIHRDFKSLNVLLDKDCRALLADFGLSKVRSDTSNQSNLQVQGTIQYLAPELLGFRPKYDSKTDIYAYGIVLWELATHEIPYGETKSEVVLSLVKQGEREEFPDITKTPHEFQQLTHLCWAQKPDERPTVENIQIVLRKMEFGKSKSQPSWPPSNRFSTQGNRGYSLQTEKVTLNSLKSEQGYALESQTVFPQNNYSSQGGYALKTETVLPKFQNNTVNSNSQQNKREVINTSSLQQITPSQPSNAVLLLEEAAKQGCAVAQYKLGVCYYEGKEVTKDYNEAVKYFRLGANQGRAEAQNKLGVCYYKGKGVIQDYTEAVKYFRLAANQGNADAQDWLGVCYAEGNGVNRDYPQAIKYYHLAINQNRHTLALLHLGVCFMYGNGVKKDEAEGLKYYGMAADQGLVTAQMRLGETYSYMKDDVQALKYYRMAADQGVVTAQSRVGRLYQNGGTGVKKDIKQAKYYFQLAGDKSALQELEKLTLPDLKETSPYALKIETGLPNPQKNSLNSDMHQNNSKKNSAISAEKKGKNNFVSKMFRNANKDTTF